jgi:hypothetical protein
MPRIEAAPNWQAGNSQTPRFSGDIVGEEGAPHSAALGAILPEV